jgi:hypothetical protein
VLENGQHDSYPRSETIPLEVAIEAVQYIVDNDAPDPRIHWKSRS